jgi:hypothetical protein
LESFVLGEGAKLATCHGDESLLHNYRHKDENEADFVRENAPRDVVGVQLKGLSAVTTRDFAELRKREAACRHQFCWRLMLHYGTGIHSFGGEPYSVADASVRTGTAA